jgi:hypothetical protein
MMDDDIITTLSRPLQRHYRGKNYNIDGGKSYNIATIVATLRSYNIATNVATSRSYNIATNVATSRNYNIAATAMRVAATDIREIWRWPAALQLL